MDNRIIHLLLLKLEEEKDRERMDSWTLDEIKVRILDVLMQAHVYQVRGEYDQILTDHTGYTIHRWENK